MIEKIMNAEFIADAFGPMPVWSLKENDEKWYVFLPKEDYKAESKMARINDLFRKINETFDRDSIYITGEVEWEKHPETDAYKVIKDLAVKRVLIIPDGLMELGQPGSRNIGDLG